MKKGLFIVIEGIDGSGKSTQTKRLAEWMQKSGKPVYLTCEPSEGPIGTQLRQVLKGRIKAESRVIAALFAADRLDHLTNEIDGILAKLKEGITVICDRYYFSSYAYHSLDVPIDWVISLNEESRKMLKADLTIFLDVDADTAMERILKNRTQQELFEKKSSLARIREHYLKAFARFGQEENIFRVDGTLPETEVARILSEKIKGLV